MRSFSWLSLALCASLFPLTGLAGFAAESEPPAAVLEANGLRVVFAPSNTVSIQLDEVPFSESSSFWVVAPHWTSTFYSLDRDTSASKQMHVERSASGEQQLVFPMVDEHGCFKGKETLSVRPDRTLVISVQAEVTTSAASWMEHRMAGIFAGWLTGRPYEVVDAQGNVKKGVLPSYAHSVKLDESTLFSGFRALRIDGPTGPIDIQTSSPLPISLVDYRKNEYAGDLRMFWFGILENSLKPQEPFQYEVSIHFPPKAETGAAQAEVSAQGSARKLDRALAAQQAEDRVIPTPKQIKWGEENLEIGPKTQILAAADAPGQLEEAVALGSEFAADVERDFGTKLAVAKAAEPTSGAIVLRLLSGAEAASAFKSEEYRLKVAAAGAELDAATSAGLVAGLNTLRQLVRVRDESLYLRGCDVSDYPSMPFRSVHFFTGKNAGDLQVKTLRRIMGALKMNALVYQCDYMKWNTHPEIFNTTLGMEQSEAKKVVEEARRQHIEIIPLVNTFGHCEWLLDNPAHRDLADDPQRPYTYDPSNPKVYEITADIYREAIEFFKPRMFHIGHDEIDSTGFPSREANRKAGVTTLVQNDTLHYYKMLKDYGIRTMLWGDMFLYTGESPDATRAPSQEDAVRRREALPKDVVVADWHYAPAATEEFKSLKIFNDAGLDAVACTWDRPENILHFSREASKEAASGQAKGKTLGIMQTTWAGYSFDQKSFDENANQYAAYVLAAEAAWTGAPCEPEKMPFDYKREFGRLWNADRLPRMGARGWSADLNSVANFSLKAKDGEVLPGFQKGEDLRAFPVGETTLERFRYNFPGEKDAPRAVLLEGQFNPTPGAWPARLSVPVDSTATLVMFAVAATLPGPPGAAVASSAVNYEDGTSEKIDWRLTQTVYSLEDERASADAPVLWRETPKDQTPRVVHGYQWKNPAPAKKIKSIDFRSANRGSALVVFGISGIQY